MDNKLFNIVLENAKVTPGCDFPKDVVIFDICSDMTCEQLSRFCPILLGKGVLKWQNGKIVTSRQHFAID